MTRSTPLSSDASRAGATPPSDPGSRDTAPDNPAPDDAASVDLATIGWDDGWADARQTLTVGPPGQPGRVARVDRGACDVLTAAGSVRVTVAAPLRAAAAADPTAAPCVGDWVLVRDDLLEAVLPRRTAVVRASVTPGTSHGQVLAANVDVGVVVEPLLPQPDLGRIERFLALVWESGAQPMVVLTKADLVADAADQRADAEAAAPGVDVRTVSLHSPAPDDGVAALRGVLSGGGTVALLGPSGAGKSSLTNALLGQEAMVTRTLRADGKGRHTTAHRELFVVPGGGLVVDTPGLRSVGLTGMEEGLDAVFTDVEELAADCRFADCSHLGEPGCAVLAAVESGDLPLRRFESWRKLGKEAAYMARKHDARLRAVEAAKWKRVSAEMRRAGRNRP